MPNRIGFASLLIYETRWHDGSGQLTYSAWGADGVADYYRRIDRDGDGTPDRINLGAGVRIDADADVTLEVAEAALMELAIETFNEVSNVGIVAAAPGQVGDLVFGSAGMNDRGLFGFAFFPDPDGPGEPGRRGDVWVNTDNRAQAVSEFGHTSWNTFQHELGHALGLAHPNEDPDNRDGARDNSNQYTVMSYVPHPSVEDLGLRNQSFPITLQMYDILAMQSLYGVNTETRSGDTTYLGDHGGGELAYQYGAADMTVNGRSVILTVWDAGGHDHVDASDVGYALRIDLRNGAFSTIGAIENNFAIAEAVRIDGVIINLIEDATGGVFADMIRGNGGDNTLRGNAGGDDLRGLGGADTLRGGLGGDWLFGGAGDDTLRGDEGRDRHAGGGGADTFLFVGRQGNGRDVIADFEDGIDLIEIRANLRFADLEITRAGSGTLVEWGSSRVLLRGVDRADVDAGDFDLG